MRLPATTGAMNTGVPRSTVAATLPLNGSTPTSCPLDEVAHSRLPASTGPDQVPAASLVAHRILPSARVMAISWPPVSTTNTLSPATHGCWMLATVSDHSCSPLFCPVAIMRPPCPTAYTTPPYSAGRAASLSAPSEDAVRVRASVSCHIGWPLDVRNATTSPVG